MIRLTDSAVRHLQALVAEHGGDGKGLRLFVERGGCAGMQYSMNLDHPHEGDEVIEQDGVQLIVAPDSIEFLRGSTIDYCDDLTGTGFRIQNPNAVRSCGCGTSFETAETAPAGEQHAGM
jgi:iron-sulfur cluster assembly protein